jgi:hypothetical protein
VLCTGQMAICLAFCDVSGISFICACFVFSINVLR